MDGVPCALRSAQVLNGTVANPVVPDGVSALSLRYAYGAFEDCTWVLDGGDDRIVVLNFTMFETSTEDVLRVYDGLTSAATAPSTPRCHSACTS
jgi:hypothetical protein